VNDPIETAAKTLTADEARVLAHYANNENAGDIAITLEMDRNYVVKVIREKGRDNRQYAQRVALVWQQKNRVPRPIGGVMTADVIASSIPVPPPPPRTVTMARLPAALRAAGPAGSAAAKAFGRTVAAASPRKTAKAPVPEPIPPAPVEPDPEPAPVTEQEETPVPQLVDDETATTLAEDLPLHAYSDPEPEPIVVPAGPTPAEPASAASANAGAETFEQLIDRAERCGNADVEMVARNLRADFAALAEALDIVARAGLLQERIDVLDEQIDEKVRVRDKLRAELESLMSSGVMVSVASGHLRKPVTGDPDEATLRAWGIRNGFELSTRGRVPGAVLIAYRKSHGLAAA
jgi:hypothetical protein